MDPLQGSRRTMLEHPGTRTRRGSSGSTAARSRTSSSKRHSGRASPTRRTKTSFSSRWRTSPPSGPRAGLRPTRARTCSQTSQRGTPMRVVFTRYTMRCLTRGRARRRLTHTCPILSSGPSSKSYHQKKSRARSYSLRTRAWSSTRHKKQTRANGISTRSRRGG